MRIAVLFKPATGVESSNEALNIVRHRPEVFIPVASSSIGGKPGLVEVETLFGHMYYPVAELMAGLRKLDSSGLTLNRHATGQRSVPQAHRDRAGLQRRVRLLHFPDLG